MKIAIKLTMDLLEARFDRYTGRRVLVQWAEVPSEFELLLNVDGLISEDYSHPVQIPRLAIVDFITHRLLHAPQRDEHCSECAVRFHHTIVYIENSQLVLLHRRQMPEIHTQDLSANRRRKVCHLGRRSEEILVTIFGVDK